MAKQKKNEFMDQVRKVEAPLKRFTGTFSDLMDRFTGSANERERKQSKLADEVDDIIDSNIKGLTDFTGDDISIFLTKLFNDYETPGNSGQNIKSIEDIFANESGGAFSFFQERYKNQNVLFEDLQMICSQLYELREAVMATRDAIVTSDDLTQSVSRTISLKNSSQDNTQRQSIISVIESVEERFDLTSKIKDHIIPNTLQYGTYYVYTVPYHKLFQQHSDKKAKLDDKMDTALESFVDAELKDFRTGHKLTEKELNLSDMRKSFESIRENIEVYNDGDLGLPLVENTHFGAFLDEKFQKQAEKAKREQNKDIKNQASQGGFSMDGTVDPKKKSKAKAEDFSDITDCYIKLIDPTKMIPVKILNETIGYYYVHQKEVEVARSPFTTSIKMSTLDPKEIETSFLTKITDKIVKAFDRKYLEDNPKFKELILNALIYNDVYKKQLKFQFIPVDYITEFTVNKNEEGEGTSVLLPSLFYAKLYLSLLIFKMLTIISRSNDTRVYYVQNSGLEQNMANQVQEAARALKARQINFMDLLNYNSMMGKIGQAKDLFMPIGSGGEQGIKFDILQGQDVQLNTELMELLRTGAINSTGVPSVIMNYINEADYAKTLVIANAKFLGRVVSQQLELNPAITEMYRKILRFSTNLDDADISSVVYRFNTPRALSASNASELISNTDTSLKFMLDADSGVNGTMSEDDNRMKDHVYLEMAKEMLPMLPWHQLEMAKKRARLSIVKTDSDKSLNTPDATAEQ